MTYTSSFTECKPKITAPPYLDWTQDVTHLPSLPIHLIPDCSDDPSRDEDHFFLLSSTIHLHPSPSFLRKMMPQKNPNCKTKQEVLHFLKQYISSGFLKNLQSKSNLSDSSPAQDDVRKQNSRYVCKFYLSPKGVRRNTS